MSLLNKYLKFLNEENKPEFKKPTGGKGRWCRSHCWNVFHVIDANNRYIMGFDSYEDCIGKCMKHPVTWKDPRKL